MKKTLAAVLAAAMALSTASVAFATDTPVDAPVLGGFDTTDSKTNVEYGEDYKAIIDDLAGFSAAELGQLVDDGVISVSAIVTEGSSKLASKPSISEVNISTADDVVVTGYEWADGINNVVIDGKTICGEGLTVKGIPVTANGVVTTVAANIEKILYKGDDGYGDALAYCITNDFVEEVERTTDAVASKALQLKFKVAHTYGTGSTEVKMKFRITVRKDDEAAGLEKGDTYTSDEVTFKAEYHELTSYSEDMELTLTEVDENNVKLKAENLYSEIGAENFVIYFDDTAAFSAKLSSAQKDVNLYYSVDEIEAVTDAYPDVDFEFISFYGAPSFLNSGSMTFNAIGAKNTTVYSFDGETLTPLDTTYDSTYGTVTAKGIKKLTTFVVADQVLEVEEEEEPAEEVTETPEVDESNPNTGAC